MKIVDWAGWEVVIELIDNGVGLDKIADRWGWSVHPVADAFLSCHVQLKRMILKEYHDAHKDKRQLLRKVLQKRFLRGKHELAQEAMAILENASAKAQKKCLQKIWDKSEKIPLWDIHSSIVECPSLKNVFISLFCPVYNILAL